MTTTETPTPDCQGLRCEEPATHVIYAQHFDPDMNDDGRVIGWSRPRRTTLCADCVQDWQEDEMIAICSTEEIR